MQLTKSGLMLFSPSDIVSFLECRHASLLSRMALGNKTEKAKEDAGLVLLQKKGIEHERAYLDLLKQQGGRIAEIPGNIGRRERVELSLMAMLDGFDAIYQAALYSYPWVGYADFLIRTSTPSSLGAFSYEALDTKLARNPEPKHIIQLCAYSEFLAHAQGILPEHMYLFLGNSEKRSFRVPDFYAYYKLAKKRFETFQKESAVINSPKNISSPMPCGHCDFCAWRDVCADRWEKEDHLCFVANITRGQMKKLQQNGITTLADLARSPKNTRVPDMQPETFSRLRAQAGLQLDKRTTGKNKVDILPQAPRKGFARLPLPDEGDLFFDMEGDPYHPDGLEYLFGVYYTCEGKYIYLPFWGHDHMEEKEAFSAFMAFVAERLARYPNAHIYHYNHYETTALKRLACRYALCEEQLDNLLRQQKFVDLYPVVRESMRTSEPGYSIKNLETFYLEKRKNAVTSAGDSVVMYNRWRELGDAILLQEIADYNEIDCLSTFALRQWLVPQRPSDLPWFKSDKEETIAAIQERKPWEIEYGAYCRRLLEVVPEPGENAPAIPPERSLLAHILEFHRREAKPQWWNSFSRQDKYEEELLDDVECIAGLRLQGKPEPARKSLIYTYRFPSQEYKAKVKDTVVNVEDMQRAGTIVSLDDQNCVLQITRSASNPSLPEFLHIGPQGPIKTDAIRNALYRFVDGMLSDPQKNTAGREILRRSLPCIACKSPGVPLVSGPDVLAEAIDAVAGLRDSYLFIQGPPGTGKTYTSGHIIVELIAQGHKVGVSSNSHKAIHNLLRQVEKAADEKGIAFSGIKKSRAGDEETVFEGKRISSVSSVADMPLNSALYAGTAWLFADATFDGLLDYLFIDEAGQVALANVIAMSGAARNIVLVGDQMQLGQPVQGTHPGESGTSVLEYLLRDEATIPPERGIFLAETRRMAPGVCSFVSESFYDGRLTAHPDTSLRQLELSSSDTFSLSSGGIAFVEATHYHCGQKSREEGEIVRSIYLHLLKATFHDRQNGSSRTLTPNDILIVSPYNMQVNLLQSLLPEARVGTVDKFQGQEAPVVIFSMATSSAEDLPRNLDFLFSKNRLNVAISRAQCLAVVVASPLLAEAPCKTVTQMRLVNTFCRLYEGVKKIET